MQTTPFGAWALANTRTDDKPDFRPFRRPTPKPALRQGRTCPKCQLATPVLTGRCENC